MNLFVITVQDKNNKKFYLAEGAPWYLSPWFESAKIFNDKKIVKSVIDTLWFKEIFDRAMYSDISYTDSEIVRIVFKSVSSVKGTRSKKKVKKDK